MNPHVDAEVLAELAEGLLDDETAAEATAHLRDCAECRQVADALAGVTHTLAATPAPAMPAHVAAGIDARLAEEFAARAEARTDAPAAAEGPAESEAGAEVVSLSSARRLRWSRALAAAAAAVVLVGGGFTVARDMLQQREAASSAPHASQKKGDGGESDQLLARAAAPTVHSGTDYTAAGLSTQAEALVRRVPSTTSATPEPQIGAEGAAPSAGIARCLAGIADRTGRTVLLADEARYEGKPATLVVLSGPSAGTAEVLVVPGECTAADSAVARRVTVPRS